MVNHLLVSSGRNAWRFLLFLLIAWGVASAQNLEQTDQVKPILAVQSGHLNRVMCLTESSDGELIASGDKGGRIKIWDVKSGLLLYTLEAYSKGVEWVAFSPTNNRLLSKGDNHISVWKAKTFTLERVIEAPDRVTSLTFGSGNSLLAVASKKSGVQDGQNNEPEVINVWDLEMGRLVQSLRKVGNTRALAISPDENWLAVSGPDEISFWSLTDGRLLTHANELANVRFSPDSRFAVTGARVRNHLLHTDSFMVSGAQVRKHPLEVPGEQYSVITWRDHEILTEKPEPLKLWDMQTGAVIKTYEESAAPSWATESKAATHLPTIINRTEAGLAKDPLTLNWLRSFAGVTSGILSVAFNRDGTIFGTGSGTVYADNDVIVGDDFSIKVWDVVSGNLIRQLSGHTKGATSLKFNADGSRAVSASWYDRTVKYWDVSNGSLLWSLNANTYRADLSPDGKYVVFGTGPCRAELRDALNGQLVRKFSYEACDNANVTVGGIAAFTPDGSSIAVSHFIGKSDNDYNEVLRLYSVTSGEALWTTKLGTLRSECLSLEFDRGGRFLVAGGEFKEVFVLDAKTGEVRHTLRGNNNLVNTVSVSPNSRFIMAGGWDGALHVWDAGSGQKIGTLGEKLNLLEAVSFSPDGRLAVAGGRDGAVKMWRLPDSFQGQQSLPHPSSEIVKHEIGSLYGFADGNWAVIDRSGRYDAANGGKVTGLHWVVGREIISLEQLKERYYEPNLLPKLLGLNKEPMRDINAFKEVKLFPAVAYEPPSPGSTKMTLKLTDRGGGIGRVQVFVNGKEITADARGLNLDKRAAQRTLAVDVAGAPYIAGKPNEIRVVTWNAEGYLASRGEVRTWTPTGTAETEEPQLYAIVAGVSKYFSPDITLRFPDKDATDMARAISVGAKRLFGAERAHVTLFNTSGDVRAVAPRKANLKQAFEEVARKARPWDILVVYLAGHGTGQAGTDSYFFLTQEARGFSDLEDPAVRAQVSISSEELTDWVKRVPALKQIMVLDTCAAGQAAAKLVEKRAVSGDQIRAIERLKDRTGFHVLMGSASDAVSWEASQYGQGLLTYALLQGMRGAALRDGEFVDIGPLFQYAADQVPRLARNIGGIQRPLIAAPRGTSFDIGRLDKGDKEAIPLALVKPLVLRPVLINPDEGTDSLGLMPALRKSLNEESFTISLKGDAQTLVYVDADELPGAVRPSGTYTVEGQKVNVRLFLTRDGQKIGPLLVEGPTGDQSALASRITGVIKEAVRQFKN